MSPNNHTLDITTLETWLWEAACKIRGPVDAPKFKDYILPLVFLKRLSDVFDDEVARLGNEFGSRATAERLVEDDHDLVRFYLPLAARWSHLAKLTTGLGEALTDAVRAVSRENPKLAGVIDVVDFNATQAGQRKRATTGCGNWCRCWASTGWACATSSPTSWAAPTSTSCASSPRGRGRARVSSTPRARWGC